MEKVVFIGDASHTKKMALFSKIDRSPSASLSAIHTLLAVIMVFSGQGQAAAFSDDHQSWNFRDLPADYSIETAVIDSIVDGLTGVVLIGANEHELRIPIEDLPDGAAEGSWLLVLIRDGVVIAIELDPGATLRRMEQSRRQLERLRGRRNE